jgi:hypothetical protein
VELWFGYTTDESIRARRKKPIGWQKPVYPLLDLGMSRDDCEAWYCQRGLPIPLKSACRQCPYRSDEAWLWMKTEQAEEFERACQIDDYLRTDEIRSTHGLYRMIKGTMYVHHSCRPLRDIDFAALVAQRKQRFSMFEIELVDSCRTDGGFSCMS